MKRLSSFLALLFCLTTSLQAQKTRLGQAPLKPIGPRVKVHISPSHIVNSCTGNSNNRWCSDVLLANAILNGRKLELSGFPPARVHQSMLLVPGDYQAELTKEIRNADSTAIHQEYNVVLPDGSIWNCAVSGISE